MAVKILIKRKVPADKEKDLLALIKELRNAATACPGYVTGETMRNVEKPDEYLVISTWDSLAAWKEWLASGVRAAIQERIDALLGAKTEYDVYHYSPLPAPTLSGFKGWEGG
ncbi:MAG TPA: antibiotic biosynthesis monooxygenase [Syntrophales bacterium]|jgi:heme-degrading monooxygenase HmoA|nr:antibiotic biosynthesis monooxygenase [Syntrophales bacterium]HON23993.1 antibiotic biosynthesis monooxygenase [Syntrophales bacterium]HOU78188.1 antibiotic biosynthesis monooxygenase [Syntrophales bacterium]HPC33279.1 antibiotic biosynthesis monooxygenase [Syntrophales bacterium]HQG35158.1 antibiotic biosynthesis monooxygenase [Syntrophales bacterium]